jgi:hypothetical protein
LCMLFLQLQSRCLQKPIEQLSNAHKQ